MPRSYGKGSVYQLKDVDSWYLNYTHPITGKRIRESAKTTDRQEAELILSARLAGDKSQSSVYTVADLLDDYFQNMEFRQLAWTKNAKSASRCVIDRFGHIRANKLTSKDVREFMLVRSNEGKANATVNRSVVLLKSAYNYAIREGRLKSEEVPRIEKFSEKENVRTGFLTVGDLIKIEQHLAPHYRDVLWFAFYSCWRAGEIINLEWSEVNFPQRKITLSPRKVKNRDIRILPLEAEILDIIGRRQGRRVPNCSYVFHRDGIKFAKRIWKPFKKAFRSAGYPNNTFHDLRRSGIRRLVLAGVPQVIAMKISGHRTDTVFRRYAIMTEADLSGALIQASRNESTDQWLSSKPD